MTAEKSNKLAGANVARISAVLVMFLGFAFRLSIYWRRPSLWNDEVYVALNVVSRNFAGLLSKLDLNQSAPIGFLWLERLAVISLGVSEYSLRLIPFLCGLASLPLSWYAARKYVSDAGALLVVSAIAFSSCAIAYSTEVKPYGVDLFVTLLLLFIASRSPSPAIWALIGSLALFLSMPSMFVLAGIWIEEAIAALRRRASARVWAGWFGAGACWAAVFWALFSNIYAPVANSSFMRLYWAPASFHLQPNLATIATLILRGTLSGAYGLQVGAGLGVEGGTFPLPLFAVTAILFLLGLVRAPRMVAVPFFLLIIAAAFEKWVFADRLMLFFIPLAALAIACATDWLFSFLRWDRLAVVFVLVLSVLPARYSFWVARHAEREALRETVEFVMNRMPASGSVYCYYKSAPAWLFYTVDWRSPDLGRVGWILNALRSMDEHGGIVESRRRNIQGEGFGVFRPWRGGWEIIGVPDGVLISIAGRSTASADEGWVENEYALVRLHAQDSIALVGIAAAARGFPDLELRFVAEGATPGDQWSGAGARAVFLKLPWKRVAGTSMSLRTE